MYLLKEDRNDISDIQANTDEKEEQWTTSII